VNKGAKSLLTRHALFFPQSSRWTLIPYRRHPTFYLLKDKRRATSFFDSHRVLTTIFNTFLHEERMGKKFNTEN